MDTQRFFSLLFLFISCNLLCAQAPVITVSDDIKVSKNKSFGAHLYSDANAHFVYFDDENSRTGINLTGALTRAILEKYDKDFSLVFSKELSVDKKGIASLGMRYYNSQFLWLYSETNKRDDYIKYNLMPIDFKGKKSKALEIAKLPYESRGDKPTIYWNVSRDSSKLLFRAVTDDDRDDEPFKAFISVLNKELNMVWSQKVKLKYTEKQVEILATHLKNDGTVYMLAKIYESRNAKESKKNEDRKSVAAYNVVLFQFSQDEQKSFEFPVNLGESFVRGGALGSDAQGNLKCAGFYSNKRNGALSGVFYLNIDGNGAIQSSNKKQFTVEELKNFGERNTDKDRGGDFGLEDSFQFSDFLIREDGSAVVVAEENYSITSTNYYYRTYTTTTRYYSNDIISFFIDPDGNIGRTVTIPKYQVGVNTRYFLSHVAAVAGNAVAFFYNEDKANLSKPILNNRPRIVNDFNDCVAVMTSIGPNGELTRKPLFEAGDLETLFVPNYSSMYDRNKLFFVCIRPRFFGKNNYKFVTLELPRA